MLQNQTNQNQPTEPSKITLITQRIIDVTINEKDGGIKNL